MDTSLESLRIRNALMSSLKYPVQFTVKVKGNDNQIENHSTRILSCYCWGGCTGRAWNGQRFHIPELLIKVYVFNSRTEITPVPLEAI